MHLGGFFFVSRSVTQIPIYLKATFNIGVSLQATIKHFWLSEALPAKIQRFARLYPCLDTAQYHPPAVLCVRKGWMVVRKLVID